MKTRTRTICKAGLLALALSAGSASAAQIYWTDWTGVDLDSGNGFRGVGTITTSNATVTVTYTNPQGIAFYQTSGGNDYYRNGTDGPGHARGQIQEIAASGLAQGFACCLVFAHG